MIFSLTFLYESKSLFAIKSNQLKHFATKQNIHETSRMLSTVFQRLSRILYLSDLHEFDFEKCLPIL